MLDTEQITKLLKSFHTVTGIKVVVFDPMFNEILAYPEQSCEFCRYVKDKYGSGCKKSESTYDHCSCKKCGSGQGIERLYYEASSQKPLPQV